MKIEGRNSVAELIKTDATIDKILVQNGMRDAASRNLVNEYIKKGVKISYADKSVLDKQSSTGKHQGFIAFTSDFEYVEIDDIFNSIKDRNCLIVLLDGIEDPHNLGSIIRVCECGGVDGLIIGKHRSASVTDAVMRISEGSANHVKIARVVNINSAIEELKKQNIWIYGLELGGENIYSTDLKGRTAIVIGGENTGINKLSKSKCDKVITIPMYGKINSLNASVAAGIAVFEADRQRH